MAAPNTFSREPFRVYVVTHRSSGQRTLVRVHGDQITAWWPGVDVGTIAICVAEAFAWAYFAPFLTIAFPPFSQFQASASWSVARLYTDRTCTLA